MLQENVQFYKKHNISRIFDEDEFRVHIDRESIVPHKADKYGRPVLYMRLRLSKPKEDTDDRKLMLYMLWTMKEVSRRMPKHCDNYILVYDLKEAGLGNINLSQMSGAAKETGSQFPERMYKIIVLNSAWWVDWSWGAIKKIMYPKTVEKVKFFKKKELPEALEEYIPIENIPEEFGGLDKEYATKFRQ